ncbi:MAG TPA: protein kinase, partial [Thermoanaerobaculia bacterium]|nr:protein kinase [Thermoanaerobaculia bacterium]
MVQPGTTLGPYQIINLIGEGGMGSVYRAKDTRLGRDVAVKVLTNVAFSDRERLLRFEQEARATGMLNHPNLLTVYDVGRDEQDNPFLVTELLEGETLRSRLERGALSPRKAVDAALQMAQGLAAAHDKGIVHRDLKPDNIFLTRDGRLKILDFGIAKLTSRAGADGPTFEMAATEPGMVMGTVGYMSPEQVRGEAVDHRSDIFSLGTIFFEMLTGARAFKRNSAVETLSAILKEDPPDLTDLLPTAPPALERLLRRCLEKDRDQRFQSARDLGFNLDTLAAMSGTSTLSGVPRQPAHPTPAPSQIPPTQKMPLATPPTVRTTARPVQKPKRRRVSPVLLALLYLVSIAGAAYAAWWWARRDTQEVAEPQFHRLTFRRGEVRSARFSPDGETIVYSAAWDGQPSQVFVVSKRATEARPLEIDDSEVLSVSADAELAILLHRDRVSNLGTLARVPLAGGVPREMANDVLQADWAPDGQSLAIIRQQSGKTRVEYPIGTVKYETPHYVRDVRVSPDGKRLAILEPSQGEWELAIIDSASPVTIARGWARGAKGIAWSRDGREVWVSGTNSAASPPALYAVDVENGTMRLVTRLAGGVRIFDLSATGETLMSNETWRAALMWSRNESSGRQAVESTSLQAPAATTTMAPTPLDDSKTRRLEDSEKDASWLDWSILADLSPDGRTLLFSETRQGG